MKRALIILTVAIATSILAVSCQEKDKNKPERKIDCTAQESYDIPASSAKSVSFDIFSNTPWRIESSESWCKVSPSTSEESSLSETIIIKFEDNITDTKREASISIIGEGIEKPILVKFMQDMPGKITVNPFTDKFPKEGGSQEFTIISNKAWRITATPSDWLTFEPSSGEASAEEVKIKATAKYTDGKGHTATVTISNTDDVKSFEASIEGVLFKIDELDEGEKVFDYKGGIKKINVNANIDWEVSSSDPNIKVGKVDGGFNVSAPMSKWFGKKSFVITVKPTTAIQGIDPINTEMHIAPASYINDKDESAYKINEDGSVTLTLAEKGNAFMKTFDKYKYGNYVWEFENVNLQSGVFCVNNWIGNFYLMLKYGHGTAMLASGGETRDVNNHKVGFGFDGGWDNVWNDTKKFTAGTFPTDYTQLKTIRLLIKPTKRTGTNQNLTLSRKVWINGKLVLDNSTNVGDVWAANAEMSGFQYMVGVQDVVGSITIKSFEIDTDYKKYEND